MKFKKVLSEGDDGWDFTKLSLKIDGVEQTPYLPKGTMEIMNKSNPVHLMCITGIYL